MKLFLKILAIFGIVLASLSAVGGITVGIMYLTGALDDEVVDAGNISFDEEVYKVSENFTFTVNFAPENTTQKNITLSFFEGETVDVGDKITDGTIIIPKYAKVGEPISVELSKNRIRNDEDEVFDWIRGGISKVRAVSENNLVTSAVCEVRVDVPVQSISVELFLPSDKEFQNPLSSIVSGSVFFARAKFFPEESAFKFSGNEKKLFVYEIPNESAAYINNLKDELGEGFFEAKSSRENIVIRARAFKNASIEEEIIGSTTLTGDDLEEFVFGKMNGNNSLLYTNNTSFVAYEVGSFSVNGNYEGMVIGSVLTAPPAAWYTFTPNTQFNLYANFSYYMSGNLGIEIRGNNREVNLESYIKNIGIKFYKLSGNTLEPVSNEISIIEESETFEFEGASYFKIKVARRDVNESFFAIAATDIFKEGIIAEVALFEFNNNDEMSLFGKKYIGLSPEMQPEGEVSWLDAVETNEKVLTIIPSGEGIASTSYDFVPYVGIPQSNVYKRYEFFAYFDPQDVPGSVSSLDSYATGILGEVNGVPRTSKRYILGAGGYDLYELNSGEVYFYDSGKVKIMFMTVLTDYKGLPILDDMGRYQPIRFSGGASVSFVSLNINVAMESLEGAIVVGESSYVIPKNNSGVDILDRLAFVEKSENIFELKVYFTEEEQDLFVKLWNSGLIKIIARGYNEALGFSQGEFILSQLIVYKIKKPGAGGYASGDSITDAEIHSGGGDSKKYILLEVSANNPEIYYESKLYCVFNLFLKYQITENESKEIALSVLEKTTGDNERNWLEAVKCLEIYPPEPASIKPKIFEDPIEGPDANSEILVDSNNRRMGTRGNPIIINQSVDITGNVISTYKANKKSTSSDKDILTDIYDITILTANIVTDKYMREIKSPLVTFISNSDVLKVQGSVEGGFSFIFSGNGEAALTVTSKSVRYEAPICFSITSGHVSKIEKNISDDNLTIVGPLPSGDYETVSQEVINGTGMITVNKYGVNGRSIVVKSASNGLIRMFYTNNDDTEETEITQGLTYKIEPGTFNKYSVKEYEDLKKTIKINGSDLLDKQDIDTVEIITIELLIDLYVALPIKLKVSIGDISWSVTLNLLSNIEVQENIMAHINYDGLENQNKSVYAESQINLESIVISQKFQVKQGTSSKEIEKSTSKIDYNLAATNESEEYFDDYVSDIAFMPSYKKPTYVKFNDVDTKRIVKVYFLDSNFNKLVDAELADTQNIFALAYFVTFEVNPNVMLEAKEVTDDPDIIIRDGIGYINVTNKDKLLLSNFIKAVRIYNSAGTGFDGNTPVNGVNYSINDIMNVFYIDSNTSLKFSAPLSGLTSVTITATYGGAELSIILKFLPDIRPNDSLPTDPNNDASKLRFMNYDGKPILVVSSITNAYNIATMKDAFKTSLSSAGTNISLGVLSNYANDSDYKSYINMITENMVTTFRFSINNGQSKIIVGDKMKIRVTLAGIGYIDFPICIIATEVPVVEYSTSEVDSPNNDNANKNIELLFGLGRSTAADKAQLLEDNEVYDTFAAGDNYELKRDSGIASLGICSIASLNFSLPNEFEKYAALNDNALTIKPSAADGVYIYLVASFNGVVIFCYRIKITPNLVAQISYPFVTSDSLTPAEMEGIYEYFDFNRNTNNLGSEPEQNYVKGSDSSATLEIDLDESFETYMFPNKTGVYKNGTTDVKYTKKRIMLVDFITKEPIDESALVGNEKPVFTISKIVKGIDTITNGDIEGYAHIYGTSMLIVTKNNEVFDIIVEKTYQLHNIKVKYKININGRPGLGTNEGEYNLDREEDNNTTTLVQEIELLAGDSCNYFKDVKLIYHTTDVIEGDETDSLRFYLAGEGAVFNENNKTITVDQNISENRDIYMILYIMRKKDSEVQKDSYGMYGKVKITLTSKIKTVDLNTFFSKTKDEVNSGITYDLKDHINVVQWNAGKQNTAVNVAYARLRLEAKFNGDVNDLSNLPTAPDKLEEENRISPISTNHDKKITITNTNLDIKFNISVNNDSYAVSVTIPIDSVTIGEIITTNTYFGDANYKEYESRIISKDSSFSIYEFNIDLISLIKNQLNDFVPKKGMTFSISSLTTEVVSDFSIPSDVILTASQVMKNASGTADEAARENTYVKTQFSYINESDSTSLVTPSYFDNFTKENNSNKMSIKGNDVFIIPDGNLHTLEFEITNVADKADGTSDNVNKPKQITVATEGLNIKNTSMVYDSYSKTFGEGFFMGCGEIASVTYTKLTFKEEVDGTSTTPNYIVYPYGENPQSNSPPSQFTILPLTKGKTVTVNATVNVYYKNAPNVAITYTFSYELIIGFFIDKGQLYDGEAITEDKPLQISTPAVAGNVTPNSNETEISKKYTGGGVITVGINDLFRIDEKIKGEVKEANGFTFEISIVKGNSDDIENILDKAEMNGKSGIYDELNGVFVFITRESEKRVEFKAKITLNYNYPDLVLGEGYNFTLISYCEFVILPSVIVEKNYPNLGTGEEVTPLREQELTQEHLKFGDYNTQEEAFDISKSALFTEKSVILNLTFGNSITSENSQKVTFIFNGTKNGMVVTPVPTHQITVTTLNNRTSMIYSIPLRELGLDEITSVKIDKSYFVAAAYYVSSSRINMFDVENSFAIGKSISDVEKKESPALVNYTLTLSSESSKYVTVMFKNPGNDSFTEAISGDRKIINHNADIYFISASLGANGNSSSEMVIFNIIYEGKYFGEYTINLHKDDVITLTKTMINKNGEVESFFVEEQSADMTIFNTYSFITYAYMNVPTGQNNETIFYAKKIGTSGVADNLLQVGGTFILSEGTDVAGSGLWEIIYVDKISAGTTKNSITRALVSPPTIKQAVRAFRHGGSSMFIDDYYVNQSSISLVPRLQFEYRVDSSKSYPITMDKANTNLFYFTNSTEYAVVKFKILTAAESSTIATKYKLVLASLITGSEVVSNKIDFSDAPVGEYKYTIGLASLFGGIIDFANYRFVRLEFYSANDIKFEWNTPSNIESSSATVTLSGHEWKEGEGVVKFSIVNDAGIPATKYKLTLKNSSTGDLVSSEFIAIDNNTDQRDYKNILTLANDNVFKESGFDPANYEDLRIEFYNDNMKLTNPANIALNSVNVTMGWNRRPMDYSTAGTIVGNIYTLSFAYKDEGQIIYKQISAEYAHLSRLDFEVGKASHNDEENVEIIYATDEKSLIETFDLRHVSNKELIKPEDLYTVTTSGDDTLYTQKASIELKILDLNEAEESPYLTFQPVLINGNNSPIINYNIVAHGAPNDGVIVTLEVTYEVSRIKSVYNIRVKVMPNWQVIPDGGGTTGLSPDTAYLITFDNNSTIQKTIAKTPSASEASLLKITRAQTTFNVDTDRLNRDQSATEFSYSFRKSDGDKILNYEEYMKNYLSVDNLEWGPDGIYSSSWGPNYQNSFNDFSYPKSASGSQIKNIDLRFNAPTFGDKPLVMTVSDEFGYTFDFYISLKASGLAPISEGVLGGFSIPELANIDIGTEIIPYTFDNSEPPKPVAGGPATPSLGSVNRIILIGGGVKASTAVTVEGSEVIRFDDANKENLPGNATFNSEHYSTAQNIYVLGMKLFKDGVEVENAITMNTTQPEGFASSVDREYIPSEGGGPFYPISSNDIVTHSPYNRFSIGQLPYTFWTSSGTVKLVVELVKIVWNTSSPLTIRSKETSYIDVNNITITQRFNIQQNENLVVKDGEEFSLSDYFLTETDIDSGSSSESMRIGLPTIENDAALVGVRKVTWMTEQYKEEDLNAGTQVGTYAAIKHSDGILIKSKSIILTGQNEAFAIKQNYIDKSNSNEGMDFSNSDASNYFTNFNVFTQYDGIYFHKGTGEDKDSGRVKIKVKMKDSSTVEFELMANELSENDFIAFNKYVTGSNTEYFFSVQDTATNKKVPLVSREIEKIWISENSTNGVVAIYMAGTDNKIINQTTTNGPISEPSDRNDYLAPAAFKQDKFVSIATKVIKEAAGTYKTVDINLEYGTPTSHARLRVTLDQYGKQSFSIRKTTMYSGAEYELSLNMLDAADNLIASFTINSKPLSDEDRDKLEDKFYDDTIRIKIPARSDTGQVLISYKIYKGTISEEGSPSFIVGEEIGESSFMLNVNYEYEVFISLSKLLGEIPTFSDAIGYQFRFTGVNGSGWPTNGNINILAYYGEKLLDWYNIQGNAPNPSTKNNITAFAEIAEGNETIHVPNENSFATTEMDFDSYKPARKIIVVEKHYIVEINGTQYSKMAQFKVSPLVYSIISHGPDIEQISAGGDKGYTTDGNIYIIPLTAWAKNLYNQEAYYDSLSLEYKARTVSLTPDFSQYFQQGNSDKFNFSLTIKGAGGNATINLSDGTITTGSSFNKGTQSITVSMTIKISGVNGSWENNGAVEIYSITFRLV